MVRVLLYLKWCVVCLRQRSRVKDLALLACPPSCRPLPVGGSYHGVTRVPSTKPLMFLCLLRSWGYFGSLCKHRTVRSAALPAAAAAAAAAVAVAVAAAAIAATAAAALCRTRTVDGISGWSGSREICR